MAAEKGRSLLIKRGDGATSETFTNVAGQRSTGITIDGETVDVTNKDSAGWQELLAAAGTTSVTISGSGVFLDSAGEVLIQTSALTKSLDNYELVFESTDKFAGAFQVSNYERTGEHNGEVTYSMTLMSSGVITFTAT